MSVASDLDRRLSLTAVIAICISSMLGSGIFVLPSLAVELVGPHLWLAYLVASIGVLPAALSKSELATAMPSSGGTYVYVERTFGPLAGTIAGLGLWVSLLLKAAFALIGIGAYLSVVIDWPIKDVAIALVFFITILNIVGIGKVGSSVVVVIAVSIVFLTLLFGLGLENMSLTRMVPAFPYGAEGVLAGAGMVFVSYAGVTKVAAVAEEVIKPEKNIPKGIIVSLLLVTVIYCAVSFILTVNIPYKELVGDIKPIHTLASSYGMPAFASLAALLAVLTMASMANAGVLAASRFPFAMSRDRLLPSVLGRINPRFLTPVTSIVMSGLLVSISIALLDVVGIAKLASAFILINYMAVNLAVIVLRETRVQWYKPAYRSPLYPYLPVFGIVSSLVILAYMGSVVISAIFSVVVPGTLLYAFYGRPRTNRRGVVGIRSKRRQLGNRDLEQDLSPRLNPAEEIPSDARVVVPLFGKERSSEMLVELGLALSGGEQVEVAALTEVPEQTDIHDLDGSESANLKSLRRRLSAMGDEKQAKIHFDSIVSHDIFRTVHSLSARLHCEWLVKEWGGRTRGSFTFHNQMGWLEDHLECHVMTFRDKGIRYIRKIMVLVEYGMSDDLLIETADHLGQVYGAQVTFVVIAEPMLARNHSQKVVSWAQGIEKKVDVAAKHAVLENKRTLESIVQKTVEFDLLLMSSHAKKTFLERYFGAPEDRIIAEAACSVVVIQRQHF